MATKNATINRAAQFLGVRRLGQALPAEHKNRITDGFNEVYAQLKKEGIAAWPSGGSLPDEIVAPVAALIALNCLDTYKVSEELFGRINLAAGPDGEKAKTEIRKFITPAYESTDNPTDF